MLLSVYSLTVALSVSLPVCLKPGPAHTPVKSGLPSEARGMLSGCACEQPTQRATTAASNPMRMALSSVGSGILGRCGEDAAAIGKRHLTARGVVRSVARLEPLHLHHVANLHDVAVNTLAHQKRRRSTREPPGDDLVPRILDVDVEPDVRILPLDLFDDARHRNRFGLVVFGGERVVRQNRNPNHRDECCGERGRHLHGPVAYTGRASAQ